MVAKSVGLLLLLVAASGSWAAATPLSGNNVTFMLAAENLPKKDDMTGPDSYVRLFQYHEVTNGNWTEETEYERYGTSRRIRDNYNPQWPDVFWVWWIPGRKQKLRFEVVDHDYFSYNDVISTVDVDADTLMRDREPEYRVDMPGAPGGVLIIKKTTPVLFKLHATNLPSKDNRWGYNLPSDPYVEVYFKNSREGAPTKFMTTTVIDDENNPVWPEVIEFSQYQERTGQFLLFRIYDKDKITGDDFIGETLVSVDDLVRVKGATTVGIGSKDGLATLTIRPVTK